MQGIKLEKDLYCIGDDLKNRKFVTELVLTCPYYEGLNPCLVFGDDFERNESDHSRWKVWLTFGVIKFLPPNMASTPATNKIET